MAAALHLFKQLGEHLHILSNAEKCCFGIVLVEHVENPWGDLRPWAVIKSEEDSVFFVGKIPDESGEQFSDDFWRFDSHICGVYVGKSNNKKLPLRNIFQLMRSIGLLLKTALCAIGFILFQGCGKDDVVPQDKMVDMFVDMFIADQSLELKPDLIVQKDSMMVYPAIMLKHGVTVEQFEASMRHYVDEGESYQEILKRVKETLYAKEKQVAQQIKKNVEEKESRILTDWWAVDSVRSMPAVDLRYDGYLRAVRWLVMGDKELSDWKFADSLNTDIPQNGSWWLNNMVPQNRAFVDVFLKYAYKEEDTSEHTAETDKITKIDKKDEKTGRKLFNNARRERPSPKEGVRSLEL